LVDRRAFREYESTAGRAVVYLVSIRRDEVVRLTAIPAEPKAPVDEKKKRERLTD